MGVTWYIREYRMANGICEKTKFPVRERAEARFGTREYARNVKRAEKGAVDCRREISRLMNNNFREGKDSVLTLEYSEAGYDRLICFAGTDEPDAIRDRAEAEAKNFIRRLSRACKKAGLALRYIYVTSDMDGKKKTPVRVHHHLVINGEAAELAAEVWKLGAVWSRPIRGERRGDLSSLAEYMIEQVRYSRNAKRYTPSRNLKKPQATKPRKAKNAMAEIRVPDGCELVWRSELYAGRPQHVRYWRKPGEDYVPDPDVEEDEGDELMWKRWESERTEPREKYIQGQLSPWEDAE